MIAAQGPIPVVRLYGARQRALLRHPRPARRRGRLHHRARDQPDVRRADRPRPRRRLGRAGRPEGARYVELGPGRGTLAADALRAMRAAGLEPEVAFRRDQPGPSRRPGRAGPRRPLARRSRTPARRTARSSPSPTNFSTPFRSASWSRPATGWRERLVALDGDRFVPAAGPPVPAAAIPEPRPRRAAGDGARDLAGVAALMRGCSPAHEYAGRRGADRRLRPRSPLRRRDPAGGAAA